MKYTMDGAMAQVSQRREMIRARRRRLENRGLAGGSLLTALMLVISFFMLMREGGVQRPAMSFYGASMIPAEMGGYVLVGVASFCAAVAVTVLCIRWRDKDRN